MNGMIILTGYARDTLIVLPITEVPECSLRQNFSSMLLVTPVRKIRPCAHITPRKNKSRFEAFIKQSSLTEPTFEAIV